MESTTKNPVTTVAGTTSYINYLQNFVVNNFSLRNTLPSEVQKFFSVFPSFWPIGLSQFCKPSLQQFSSNYFQKPQHEKTTFP
ncbi:hypothetical protein Fluta_0887 [Fluviicola taffensis DSM 16823]|uniref:Uncharacterized protein n=1 Tax=Fluviicola taffensis (strain DSM 16823 / NCIMB 13979 / RW262) TaxID=755732 RepID=F2IJK0_FLUTR|nr:hypothetical protein Fluta_0887 [Fluviicola taffensis DSM 16823]